MSVILRNVSLSFEDKHVLTDLNDVLPDKGLVLLHGPSGAGKTTLLRLLAGLQKPDSGEIIGIGRVSMCFQEYRLFPQLSALRNASALLSDPRDAAGMERCREMLLTLGFTEADLQLKPGSLSGGMKQRVSLTRALCMPADTVLLDEPVKELDPVLRGKALALIAERARESLTVMSVHVIDGDDIHPDLVIRLP